MTLVRGCKEREWREGERINGGIITEAFDDAVFSDFFARANLSV
jgi:hypothetical protein